MLKSVEKIKKNVEHEAKFSRNPMLEIKIIRNSYQNQLFKSQIIKSFQLLLLL